MNFENFEFINDYRVLRDPCPVGIKSDIDDVIDFANFANDILKDHHIGEHGIEASIGNPLGILPNNYGVVASSLGYCVGHHSDPLKFFRCKQNALASIARFDDRLRNSILIEPLLCGKKFQIKGIEYFEENMQLYVVIESTDSTYDYLVGNWEWILTGVADIDLSDKLVDNLVITGISVYKPFNSFNSDINPKDRIISLIQF